jgi:murein DD-endopeptidase MepM/ murein hydrolase activator NlpD
MEEAVQEDRIQELAGNYIIIQHNQGEFSHLFHLLKGSACVTEGQPVKSGEKIGQVGFSGAATTYSHLHYQLMDGPDFLTDQALPCKFSNVNLIEIGKSVHHVEITLDSYDFINNL